MSLRSETITYATIIYSEYTWDDISGIMIDLVLVGLEYRGNGYGSMLMKRVINDNPGRLITLKVKRDNVDAIRLYRKLGFEFENPHDVSNPRKRILYMSRKGTGVVGPTTVAIDIPKPVPSLPNVPPMNVTRKDLPDVPPHGTWEWCENRCNWTYSKGPSAWYFCPHRKAWAHARSTGSKKL